MKHLIATIFLSLFIVTTSHAATITFDLPEAPQTNKKVLVDVMVDSDGRPINSVDASIAFPAENLRFEGYQDGIGVIKFWIMQPREEGGVIRFAGGIPGGVDKVYGGVSNSIPIVRLVFSARVAGNYEISVADSTILLNDGKGTSLPHSTQKKTIEVAQGEGGEQEDSDEVPPVEFQAVYIPRDSRNGTPAMIMFATHDRESGLKGYQVRVGLGAWKEATSPFEIGRPIFTQKATVKATDLNGNVQKSKVEVEGLIPQWLAIIMFLAILAGLWRYFMVKNKV